MHSLAIRRAFALLTLTLSGCSGFTGPTRPELAPGPVRTALLYIPNRVLDLTDVIRAGVEVGPGIGADVMVTDYLRLAGVRRWSKGIGYQTFRHSPFKDSEESLLQAGPARFEDSAVGVPWVMDPWDVRLEAHLLLVGAHLAMSLGEIGDFIAGIFTVDPREDDIN